MTPDKETTPMWSIIALICATGIVVTDHNIKFAGVLLTLSVVGAAMNKLVDVSAQAGLLNEDVE